MALPEQLNNAIEQYLQAGHRGDLTRAASELTSRYRSEERDAIEAFMSTTAHRLAYLSFRMPATFSVVRKVLEYLRQQMPDFCPRTLCDLGAGPGTASWAAQEVFPSLEQALLVEKDPEWQTVGKTLMRDAGGPLLKQAVWVAADIGSAAIDPADLVILSYVVGELPFEAIDSLVDKIWDSAQGAAAFIEPGTPHGFSRIRAVRDRLIARGAYLVAPCPHQRECPMSGGDWCHFSERLERSAMHRSVKEVSMGYEDEKFSYVVAAKHPVGLPDARILRHPQRHTGHIDFEVCAKEGLEKRTVSKRHKELYKAAKKLEWGDVLPPI